MNFIRYGYHGFLLFDGTNQCIIIVYIVHSTIYICSNVSGDAQKSIAKLQIDSQVQYNIYQVSIKPDGFIFAKDAMLLLISHSPDWFNIISVLMSVCITMKWQTKLIITGYFSLENEGKFVNNYLNYH